MRDEVARSLAGEFNEQWPIGTPVWLIDDLGNRHQTTTSSRAWVVGTKDHAQVLVCTKGRTGGYILERLVIINTGFVDPALEREKKPDEAAEKL